MGQRFLASRAVLQKIVGGAELSKKDTVLEIGPGKGILTDELAKKVKKVVAVEKDPRLVEFLKRKFEHMQNIEIIQGDILQISNYSAEGEISPPGGGQLSIIKQVQNRYKIVANLPYYITSRFLRIFLSSEVEPPSMMVLMVQREVADRICAKPPNMNLLALSVQAFGEPKIIARVPRQAFRPPPSVDSAIIKITDISNAFFKKNKINPKEFFTFIRKAFSQKRKMLRASLHVQHRVLAKKRPQELSLENWIQLIRSRKYRFPMDNQIDPKPHSAIYRK